MDISISDAMLVWTTGEKVAVIAHPDVKGLSDAYEASVGACFSRWRKLDLRGQQLQLMVDAWHISAFYKIPAEQVHQALLVIPEYRDMIADDCLPSSLQR